MDNPAILTQIFTLPWGLSPQNNLKVRELKRTQADFPNFLLVILRVISIVTWTYVPVFHATWLILSVPYF